MRYISICMITLIWIISPVSAQTSIEVNCGDIIEAELIAQNPMHSYRLNVDAGSQLEIGVLPIGTSLNPTLIIIDQGNNLVAQVNTKMDGEPETISDFVISSSDPEILIAGNSSDRTTSSTYYNVGEIRKVSYGLGETLGLYQLSIGCALRDGSIIRAGDSILAIGSNEQSNNADEDISQSSEQSQLTEPTFSGFGFPGLAPVDFAQGVTLDTSIGTSNSGSITPNFAGIFGFRFSAEANQPLNLTFERTAGNMNLTIVVLSENNEVLFASAITSTNRLTADLIMPASGTYTIGISEANLLSPDAPEPTSFSLVLE